MIDQLTKQQKLQKKFRPSSMEINSTAFSRSNTAMLHIALGPILILI